MICLRKNTYLCTMKKKLLTYMILMIVSCLPVIAQETIFRSFSPTLYKGGTQNWDIEQLPDGQMAIANNYGVLIFDGANWSLFHIRNYTTVRSLFYDQTTDRLYAGASNEFGYYQVDPITYQYNYHNLSDKLPAKLRSFGEIWKIIPWQDKIVFQSKSHLFILDKHGRYKTYHSPQRIETITQANGHLILATRRGLEEWRNNKSVILPGATFNKKVVVRSLLPYNGKLLIATQQNAIMTYDGKSLSEDHSELAPLLEKSQIFSAELQGDKLAIGTVRAGLIVKDLKGRDKNIYLNSSKGLQNNTILSLAFDFEGNIWLAQDNGISCALTNAPFQNIVSERASIGMGYTSLVYENKLYLGTNQGLFVQTMPLLQQLAYKEPIPISGVSGQIWNLSIIDNNLLCCADRGLYCIKNGKANKIDGPDGVWNICKLEKHPNYLLAVDYLGLVLLKKEGDEYKMVHRVKSDVESLGALFEDTDGTLWTNSWQNGIYHLVLSKDMKSVKALQLFNSHNGLVIDQNNLLCKVRGNIYIYQVLTAFTNITRKHRSWFMTNLLAKYSTLMDCL